MGLTLRWGESTPHTLIWAHLGDLVRGGGVIETKSRVSIPIDKCFPLLEWNIGADRDWYITSCTS